MFHSMKICSDKSTPLTLPCSPPSIQTLSVLVEQSMDLRMLDLRDNSITTEGVLTLMNAVTRNPR
jgi:Ran GTPase-activating protein (RanGAP) involved in mRNA processing and transport